MNVLYRLGSESTERSVRTTGMSAAFASCRTASQPVSTTGENAIRSTPWVMKVLIEEICLAWSPSAEVNCRSTLYCSADDLMESVLALRQPLSEPTWAKPITAPSSTAGSTGGSSPPASAEPEAADDALALLVAALLDEAALVAASLVLDDAVVALLPHAVRAIAAAAAAARTANFLVTTDVPPTLDDPVTEVLRSSRAGHGRVLQRVLSQSSDGRLLRRRTQGAGGERGLRWPTFRSQTLGDEDGWTHPPS